MRVLHLEYFNMLLPKHQKELLEEAKKQNIDTISTIQNTIVWNKTSNPNYWKELNEVYEKKEVFYNELLPHHKIQLTKYPEEIHNKICLNFNKKFYEEYKNQDGVSVMKSTFNWIISIEGYDYWKKLDTSYTFTYFPSLTEEEETEIYKIVSFIKSKSEDYQKFLKKCL